MGKKVLIAGYPKSGNTWLGFMLAYILGAKYIDLHAPDSKPTLAKHVLDLIEGDLAHRSDYEFVCKTHSRYSFQSDVHGEKLESFDKVIHIVRDPRDVAVSYYFFTYYSMPIAHDRPEDVLSRKFWFIRKYCWKKTVFRVARAWPLHTISWRTFEGAQLVRYEDLYGECLAVLERICDYLELQCNLSLLQEAMNHFTFERLSGGRKPGEEYPTAFFRKGVIGDYRNHFEWMDTLIMGQYAGTEMRDLGYEI